MRGEDHGMTDPGHSPCDATAVEERLLVPSPREQRRPPTMPTIEERSGILPEAVSAPAD
jgi:hypothetical protein